MKFLCDQCKAKYQIADEKVVGKTVRMKCRKCGHMIEVKAEVTETSVAGKFPSSEAPTAAGAQPAMMNPAPRPAAPKPSGAPKAPLAPQKPAPRSSLATSFASARPPAPKPLTKPDGGPLGSALNKSIQKDDDALLELHSATEWYVAINGVPVGPIRIGELKRKAATGAITDDSLCWQEGMEEWRPVRSVTELSALLREVAASGRPSLVTPPPPDVRSSQPPPAAANRPMAPRGPQPAREPSRPLAPAARSNVVPIMSRLATAEKLEQEDHTVVGDPFALPAPDSAPISASAVASAPVAAPFASPPSEAPPVLAGVGATRREPPWIALGMLVLFGAFGITAAIMLFTRPPQQAAVAAPTVTAPASVAMVTPNVTADPTATASPTASTTAEKPPVATGGGGGGGTKPAASATGKVVDPSIAALLGGPNSGPNVGGGGGGGGGGGAALSSDAIETVVRQRSAGVKRTCWERGGSNQNDVSVKVHLTIAGNGSVSNASAAGNDPAIAKCIENSVRGWSFPASGGSTDVDIPFHFLRQ